MVQAAETRIVTQVTITATKGGIASDRAICRLYRPQPACNLAGELTLQSGCAVTTPSYSPAPARAPALYVSGFVDRESDGVVVPFAFRLPCPPSWDDRLPGAWAAERRARRAYFATLDALRTGIVDPVETAKMERLIGDLRSQTARATVRHFQRVVEFVERLGGRRAVVPEPPEPMAAVVITAPPVPASGARASDTPSSRYKWALEWLSTRRFVVPKGLRVEWRVRRMTPPAGMNALGDGHSNFGEER